MTTRRDEEELLSIKTALEQVRVAQQRVKENAQSLEEIGVVLCRLLEAHEPLTGPGDKSNDLC